MVTRKRAFARLGAVLLAALFSATISVPATAAVNVGITSFRGVWASTTSYAAGVVVTYNGASYLCLVGNTGLSPNSYTAHWALLDAPGLPGATGATSAKGAQGAAGPAGAKGATGAQGLQGVAGATGAA